jgi:2-oxoisovalerate dehydrogenase E1 component
LRYFHAEGSDLAAVYDTAVSAAAWVRGAAGSHLPAYLDGAVRRPRRIRRRGGYRAPAEIAADLGRDPLLGTARLLVASGTATPAGILARYEASRERVLALAAEVAGAPRLGSAAQVMAPLAARRPDAVATEAARAATPSARGRAFGRRPEDEGPLTLAQAVNRTLADALAARPETIVFGEDVARKGGVYGVTRGLLGRFGAGRVFDTVLDEQSVPAALGATGCLLPVPDPVPGLLHNAADQILRRRHAVVLLRGQYRPGCGSPGWACQRGFGGHSTTTTPPPARHPAADHRPAKAGAATPPRCCAPAWPWPRPTAASASSSADRPHQRDLHEPGDDVGRAA